MPTRQITINGTVYAWSSHMDEAHIEARAAHDAASQLITTVTFGKLVVAALITILLFYLDGIELLLTADYWMSPSWAGVFLFLSGLFGMYLYAHQSQLRRKDAVMPDSTDISEAQDYLGGDHVNLGLLYNQEAREAIERAMDVATKFGHQHVETIHLFIGLIDTGDMRVVFARLGLSFGDIQEAIKRRLETRARSKQTDLGTVAEDLFITAFVHAVEQGRSEVSALELFAVVYQADEFIRELLLDKGINETTVENMLTWMRIHEQMRDRYKSYRSAAAFKPTGPMNRAMTSVATPILDAISEDLTTAAVKGNLPMMIERETELEDIFRIIEGGRQSVVLVGSEGVGKTTILAGIAERMVREDVPAILRDRRLVRISIPHLVSGASPAIAQQRLLTVLGEVMKSRNIILAISDIDQLVGQGADATDLAATLVDFLSRSGTFAVATCTPQAYTALVERSILGRSFQKVDIREPDAQSAIHMLQSKIGGIEYEHNVIFGYAAVEQAVTLSDRYMHERYLPKKAIEIAREVALHVKKQRGEDAFVSAEDVASIVSSKTGIPTTAVAEDEKEKLLGLEEQMMGRVIGQDEAVKAVASALKRARTNLRSEARPIATFLFLGPTGVGKTELAKTVAESYFGDENLMIRLDMSEYQDAGSINRLLGAPGSTTGGLLTEAVRKQPFAIVLLDELEKAHPDILNVFLQVFDDGRLTDAAGRTIDFTNTIIVSTSNAGAQYIQEAVARNEELETMKTHLIEEALQGIYRPEFLNRFDGVIVFKPLTQDDVEQITKLFMKQVARRLETKGIAFNAEPAAVTELAEQGYDPKFGARPLRRVVQEVVDNAIANALLEGKVKRRDTIVLEPGGTIRIEQGRAL